MCIQYQAQGGPQADLFCRPAPARTGTPGTLRAGSGSGSARSQAAPAAYEAPGLEWAVGIDWQGPGVVPEAWAELTQAAGPGLCAGQQRHLLGGHVSRGDHGGLWVTLQLPQLCRDRAAQTRSEGSQNPRPLALHPIHSHPLHPSAPSLSRTPYPGEQAGSLPWNRESSRSWLTRPGPV